MRPKITALLALVGIMFAGPVIAQSGGGALSALPTATDIGKSEAPRRPTSHEQLRSGRYFKISVDHGFCQIGCRANSVSIESGGRVVDNERRGDGSLSNERSFSASSVEIAHVRSLIGAITPQELEESYVVNGSDGQLSQLTLKLDDAQYVIRYTRGGNRTLPTALLNLIDVVDAIARGGMQN